MTNLETAHAFFERAAESARLGEITAARRDGEVALEHLRLEALNRAIPTPPGDELREQALRRAGRV